MKVWKLHWGPRLYLDLIFEPRDLWVGVFVKKCVVLLRRRLDVDCYICPLPTLVLRVRVFVEKGSWTIQDSIDEMRREQRALRMRGSIMDSGIGRILR